MSKNRKILVVGGAGYVGTELTKKLLNLNYEVSVLDLFISRFLLSPGAVCHSASFFTDLKHSSTYQFLFPKNNIVFLLHLFELIHSLYEVVQIPFFFYFENSSQQISHHSIIHLALTL